MQPQAYRYENTHCNDIWVAFWCHSQHDEDRPLGHSSITNNSGSGFGSAGRAVTSDTRDTQFESSRQSELYLRSTVLKRRKLI